MSYNKWFILKKNTTSLHLLVVPLMNTLSNRLRVFDSVSVITYLLQCSSSSIDVNDRNEFINVV